MRLTQRQLEAHLWGAANILRGKTAGQDYKNYILSLMFYKRLCDQWENEAEEAIAELERQQGRAFTEAQKAVFRARGEHRFTIPDGARWGDVLAVAENIGEKLTAAMRAISQASDELRGVFTVDWNQPAPDGSGRKLIPNEVVHALVQHFDAIDLSNQSVPPDVLGRAYEYLIKQFADDAGAKAGEFFTPPEVVDALVRILEPRPGDTIYDPTCGSAGMLIHSGDFLSEHGHRPTAARFFGQEMNWGNYAIGKINSVLHGLDADIRGGASTITDPAFLEAGRVQRFSLVLANFPFSDEFWWLQPEQQTDDKKKRAKLKTEVFAKEGYKDPYGRFGRGTPFRAPPAGYGDYAFILHIVASLAERGRAGVVCPQGVLFRGQPEVEEETGEFDSDGTPIMRRRKADDEHLIREALLRSGLVDAVISLPLNIFYGAGVPACLLILRKDRPAERRERVLLVYAARHYRELSAQNELRPQDVMRILVHYHAYGDPSRVPALVAAHGDRVRQQITTREHDELERLEAEYQPFAEKLAAIDAELAALRQRLDLTAPSPGARDARPASGGFAVYGVPGTPVGPSSGGHDAQPAPEASATADRTLPDTAEAAAKPLRTAGSSRDSRCCQSPGARDAQPASGGFAVSPSAPPPFALTAAPAPTKAERKAALAGIARLEKQREKPAAKLAERDERLAECRRRAEDDRAAVTAVGQELEALYADPDELLKHARVVGLDEIAENEFNLNIPRYVDTFEPEPRIEVAAALKALREAEDAMASAERDLRGLLEAAGYEQ